MKSDYELDEKIKTRLKARGFPKEAAWPELRWAVADVIRGIIAEENSPTSDTTTDDTTL